MSKIVHPIDMALQELKELAAEQGLMDCEIRSIFNMGLRVRHELGPLAEAWLADKKILELKSENLS
jgi:hypothetical protein